MRAGASKLDLRTSKNHASAHQLQEVSVRGEMQKAKLKQEHGCGPHRFFHSALLVALLHQANTARRPCC